MQLFVGQLGNYNFSHDILVYIGNFPVIFERNGRKISLVDLCMNYFLTFTTIIANEFEHIKHSFEKFLHGRRAVTCWSFQALFEDRISGSNNEILKN